MWRLLYATTGAVCLAISSCRAVTMVQSKLKCSTRQAMHRLATTSWHLTAAPVFTAASAPEALGGPLRLRGGAQLTPSDLMLGCAFVNSKLGQEGADDAQATATVNAAFACGIRDLDTAPYYGPSGSNDTCRSAPHAAHPQISQSCAACWFQKTVLGQP